MAMQVDELKELKRRLSPRVLQVPGVSGIGISNGTLTVYLAEDSDSIRNAVAKTIQSEAPGVSFRCLVTGAFHPQ